MVPNLLYAARQQNDIFALEGSRDNLVIRRYAGLVYTLKRYWQKWVGVSLDSCLTSRRLLSDSFDVIATAKDMGFEQVRAYPNEGEGFCDSFFGDFYLKSRFVGDLGNFLLENARPQNGEQPERDLAALVASYPDSFGFEGETVLRRHVILETLQPVRIGGKKTLRAYLESRRKLGEYRTSPLTDIDLVLEGPEGLRFVELKVKQSGRGCSRTVEMAKLQLAIIRAFMKNNFPKVQAKYSLVVQKNSKASIEIRDLDFSNCSPEWVAID